MSDHNIVVMQVIKIFSVYSCYLFFTSSASVRSIQFLSFIVPIFPCNVPLVSLTFLKRSPYAKFRLKLKKVGKTSRPSRYDLNQIPYNYTVEVTNRFKGLDLIDRVPEELCVEVRDKRR